MTRGGRAPFGALAALLGLLWAAHALALPLWADGDGDGLPDPSEGFHLTVPSDLVTVDIWVDSQSFVWTNFQVWIDRGTALEFESGAYFSRGGNMFPIDTFTMQKGIGLGGFGFIGQQGTSLLARLSFHKVRPGRAPLTFLIDPDDPSGNFSMLGTRSGYFFFERALGTSWDSEPVRLTDESGWGLVKGLYR